MRKAALVAGFILTFVPAVAQNVGDQVTAGYNNQRTYVNEQMGEFKPPLTLQQTLPLMGVLDARSFLPFGDFLAVGEIQQASTVRFHLFEIVNNQAQLRGNTTFQGSSTVLDYTPSYSQDIVLFGGPSTSTVKAIRVSTFTQLWQDVSVGGTTRRYPVLTGNLALYHGRDKLVAARADTGITLWEFPTTTAEAPLAMLGNRLYMADSADNILAFNLAANAAAGTAVPVWTAPGTGGDGASLIATEDKLFVSSPSVGAFGALDARTGSVIWAQTVAGLSESPGIALTEDRFLVMLADPDQDGSRAEIRAYEPDSAGPGGDLLWSVDESASGIDFAFVANNVLYYYNSGSQRIRARDVFTGTLLWSKTQAGVRGLSASEGRLYVLLGTSVEVYGSPNRIFFALMADGADPNQNAQSTLLSLTNLDDQAAQVTVSFFDQEGDPLVVPVDGSGDVATVQRVIPAKSSIRVQTLSGDELLVGWIQVDSNRRLRGSSIFQFRNGGQILAEAGVAESNTTGEANVLYILEQGPGTQSFFSTGVAFANPLGDEDADIQLSLLDQDGDPVAGVVNPGTVTLTVPAGGQRNAFIEELFMALFDELEITEFEGTVRVNSDVPISIIALRTQGGIQFSSYPAGQVR